MDSSQKKILTPLQSRILDYLFSENFPFFLTGGTALSAYYLYHRYSDDLDLFTLQDEVIGKILPTMELMSKKLNTEFNSVQTEPMFRRFFFTADNEKVVVDLVRDIDYQVNKNKPLFGKIRVDSFDDIVANKICAILGRQEAKDFVDLFFIAKKGYDPDKYVVLAKNKDAGINKATLAFLIKDFSIEAIPPYMLENLDINEMKEFYHRLSDKWAKESFPI
jgi:predicted nucleotidyltransferase component of viral defense system